MGSKTNKLVQCKAKGSIDQQPLQHNRPDDSPTKLQTTGDVEYSVLSQEEHHIILVIINFFLNHLTIYLHYMLPPSWAWLRCLSYTQINHITISFDQEDVSGAFSAILVICLKPMCQLHRRTISAYRYRG